MIVEGLHHGRRDPEEHRSIRQSHRDDAKRSSMPAGWLPVYGVERRKGGDAGELVVYNNVSCIRRLRNLGEIGMKTLPWVRLVLIIGFILVNFLVVV